MKTTALARELIGVPAVREVARRPGRHLVPAWCLAVTLLAWILSGQRPLDDATWLLENVPTLVALALLIGTYARYPFSNAAYVQGTVFLIIHSVGSHYTYSEVPGGEWLGALFGSERNSFDRLAHFLSGVLLTRAAVELGGLRGAMDRQRLFLGVAIMAFWALGYELVEMLVAAVLAPEAGPAFLALQGDPWDAHKDMALACIGAALAGGFELALARWKRRLLPWTA